MQQIGSTPLWNDGGFTNSPRYHAERFHTYRNCPNKREPDVAEREKHSIQEYYQCTFVIGGSWGYQDRKRAAGSEILNVSVLHIYRLEVSDQPILEIGRIWFSRPRTTYV